MRNCSRTRRGLARESRSIALTLEVLETRCLLNAGYLQTNLVSDISGMAAQTDPNLINPWGVAFSSSSPFWVADNGTGVATIYKADGTTALSPVTIPISPGGTAAHGTPTGAVFNTDSTGFNVSKNNVSASSVFLFDTQDGTISGWSPSVDSASAIVAVNQPGSSFTGLAIGNVGSQTFLYAVDNAKKVVDVFDSNFTPVMAGSFQDPNLPSTAAPFNVQNINGLLYVEYTNGPAGAGHGFVDVFNTQGQLLQRLISGGALDSPWGITLAPAGFEQFSHDLLVGNFGDGHINAFDPANGAFLGQVTTITGQPFEEDHLWSLHFGNGGNAGNPNTLFFTAGINNEKDGLFGQLQAVPPLGSSSFVVPNLPGAAQQTVSTVPANGDVNPYGVAFVPPDIKTGGKLHAGDILVSNFNNSTNTQGTGTTIVDISPDGQQSVFFQGTAPLGLTTALGVLKSGFVIVGNVPTSNGVAQQGSLLILDSNGNIVDTLMSASTLDGPWDLTINDQGNRAQVYVANVLSGGVTRIDLSIPTTGNPVVLDQVQIASGYLTRTDPNALVVGPTGLAYDAATNTLYVADTGDNTINAVANASTATGDNGKGRVVVASNPALHGPLGLVLAPNGDLIAANGDAVNLDPNNVNELVEFTPTGQLVGQFQVDAGGAGGAFGLGLSTANGELRLAAVDDDANTLETFTFRTPNVLGAGALSAVGSGSSAVVFSISPTDSIYETTSSAGSVRFGDFIQQISATADAAGNAVVFAVTTNNALARFSNSSGWQLLGAPGTIAFASAGLDSGGQADVFVVTTDGNVFEFRGSSGWTSVPTPLTGKGSITQLSAVDQDRVVALDRDGSVEEFDLHQGAQGTWFFLTSPGFAQSISAVSDTSHNVVTFAITMDNALFEHQNATGWTGIGASGTIKAISAGLDGKGGALVAAVTASDAIAEFDVTSGWSLTVPPTAVPQSTPTQLSATAADAVFITYQDGSILGQDPSQGIFTLAGPGFAQS